MEVAMTDRETLKSVYNKFLKDALDRIECLIDTCEVYDFTNEQFFIEFEDKLNKLSVKDHGKNEFKK